MYRIGVVGVLGASAWDPPSKEKFQPMIDACTDLDNSADCSVTFSGTCKSDPESNDRFCKPDCHHHGSKGGWKHGDGKKGDGKGSWRGKFGGWKGVRGSKGGGKGKGKWGDWKKHVGDCGSKQEGDVCSFQRDGMCIPSGKCPIFNGEMVCKDKAARAPDFVTAPCKDKSEGDACKSVKGGDGKCVKPKYLNDMFCKPAESWWAPTATQTPEEVEDTAEPWWAPTATQTPEEVKDAGSLGEKLHWGGGVPTWWADGKPHWTKLVV